MNSKSTSKPSARQPVPVDPRAVMRAQVERNEAAARAKQLERIEARAGDLLVLAGGSRMKLTAVCTAAIVDALNSVARSARQ